MLKKEKYINPGKELMKKIIIKFLKKDITFDYVSNVLSSSVLKDAGIEGLWLWWDSIRIKLIDGPTVAGEMDILDSYKLNKKKFEFTFKKEI